MKNIQDFVNTLEVTFNSYVGLYAHYPMQLVFKNNDGTTEICALALKNVMHIYKIIQMKKGNYKELYLSIDYPAFFDMKFDFICIISDTRQDENIKMSLLPYDNKTGQKFAPIYSGDAIQVLAKGYIDMIYDDSNKKIEILDFNNETQPWRHQN